MPIQDFGYSPTAHFLTIPKPFGINVVNNPNDPSYEFKLMDIIINNGVSCIEASAFFSVTPALIYYRAKGIKMDV